MTTEIKGRRRLSILRSHGVFVGLAMFVLADCHGDLTKRIVMNPNGAVTVDYRETLDEELYADISRIGGTDPFRLVSARSAGWQVSSSTTAHGDHVLSLSKTIPVRELQTVRFQAAAPIDATDAFNFGPGDVLNFATGLTGTNDADLHREHRTYTIPPLLQPDDVAGRKVHDPNSTTAIANAVKNAQYVDSIVSVHLELKTIVKPVMTNSARMIDGGARWDLYFSKPSLVEYAAVSHGMRIVLSIPNQQNEIGRAGPVSPLAAWRDTGNYGTFDYQRWGEPLCRVNPKYTPASNFGIGVYMRGAGVPESTMDALIPMVQSWLQRHPEKC